MLNITAKIKCETMLPNIYINTSLKFSNPKLLTTYIQQGKLYYMPNSKF